MDFAWVNSGDTPCCCPTVCNFLASSICGTGNLKCSTDQLAPVHYFKEFEDLEAVPPVVASCPPKYYRTKTVKVVGQYSYERESSYHSSFSEWTRINKQKYAGELNSSKTSEIQYDMETEVCSEICVSRSEDSAATSFYSFYYVFDDPNDHGGWWGNVYNFTSKDFVGPTYSGCDISSPSTCDRVWFDSYNATTGAISKEPPDFGNDGFVQDNCDANEDWMSINYADFYLGSPTTTTETTATVKIVTDTYSKDLQGVPYTGTIVTTTTLSDEVTMDDILTVCDVVRCQSTDDPAEPQGCRYCCTDRGETREGLAYSDPLSPEGCIIPGSSTMAWMVCDPLAPAGEMSGQSSKITMWFKDLEPDTQYKATLVYKRCSFEKDEEDEYIQPSACVAGPCNEEDPADYAEVTDEIEFVAEHWAEVYGDCEQCEVMLKVCELEDEANDWNLANPLETPRSVGCGGTSFSVPTASNKYTWANSCELEVIATPE